MIRSAMILASVSVSSVAFAADGFTVGDPVQGFALKAVNPDVVGEKIVSIDNYFGPEASNPKKAVVLSFFATYCEPCKKEMPFLSAMYDEYNSKGLSVMSVSIDNEADKIESLKSLAEQNSVKFPVLSDRFNIVAKRYYVEKLPLVYIINGEGKVSMVKTGYTEDATKTIFDEVRRLVGEPTSNPIPATIAVHMPESAASLAPVAATPVAAPVPEGDANETDAAKTETDQVAAAEEQSKKKKRKRRKRRKKKKK